MDSGNNGLKNRISSSQNMILYIFSEGSASTCDHGFHQMDNYCINGISKFGARGEVDSTAVCQVEGGALPSPSEAFNSGSA